jgi:hypothetical protein
MSTKALSTSACSPLKENVDDLDTYVSSAQTCVTIAALPPINDGGGPDVAVGTEIRFEATAGAPIIIETADGRLVGTCPGRGQVVCVAEAGAAESETDFWRFFVIPAPLTAHNAAPAAADCWAVLVANGFVKAE